MKRILFLLTIPLLMVSVSCNQGSNSRSPFNNDGGRGGMGPDNFDPSAFIDRQMDQMKESLDLTGDQEEQIRDILTEGSESMQNMREEMRNSGGDFEGMRERMQEMREDQDSKIKAVLTEEQWGKYEVMQEEMRERRGQRSGGPSQN
mgnify:CR=1 FL=1